MSPTARSFVRTPAAPGDGELSFLDALPAPPLPRPPEPDRQEDEYARHPFELVADVGPVWPLCRGNWTGASACGATGLGAGLSVAAWYRMTPHLAAGAAWHHAGYGFDPPGADRGASYSHQDYLGLVARAYFLEMGRLDPHIDVGIARTTAAVGYSMAGDRSQLESVGLGTAVGAGLDIWVFPHVRVGAAIMFRYAFLGSWALCQSSAGCSRVGIDQEGLASSEVALSFNTAVGFGRSM